MTYNPNHYGNMNYEAGRGSIYSAPPKAKSSNANEEAAKSMGSVGIGGVGGKTTTSSAAQIHKDFMERVSKKDDNKPSGLGAPTTKVEPEEDDRNLDQKIYDFFVGAGADMEPEKEEPMYMMDFYGGPMFVVPEPTPVEQQVLSSPFDEYNVETYNFGGYSDTRDTSPSIGSTVDPDLQDPRRGLMAAPTMSQPSTPEELTDIPRALAMSAAVPTKTYTIKSGDTLSEIARDNNTTVEAIMKANSQIVDKDEIDAGATIEIPKEDDGLTPTQRALRAGLIKPKGKDGVEVAEDKSLFEQALDYLGFGKDDPTGFEGMGPSPDEGNFEGMNLIKMRKDFVEGYLKGHEGTKAHKSLEGGKDTAAFGVKNSLGLKRSDYNSDKDFAAAVALKHYNKAKNKFVFDFVWDELGDAGRYAITDLHYNVGGVGSSAVKGTAKEALTNTLNYVGMTTKDGTKASLLSLSKRRAENWNKAADDLGLDKVAKIQQTPKTGGGTIIKYLNSEGDVIHEVSSGRKPITLKKNGSYKEITETKEVEIK